MNALTILNHNSKRKRSAFTLIELLVVISTLAVLASLAVGVMASAQEDSRIASTRARVQLIQKLMEVELEDYEVQRSPIPFRNLSALVSIVAPKGQWDPSEKNFRLHLKNLKRMITLDLIRAEIPDFRDGTSGSLGQFPTQQFLTYLNNVSNNSLQSTDVATISAAFQGHTTADVFRWSNWDGGDNSDRGTNSSEILFRILSDLDVDGTSGIDLLGNAAIGDTDGDQLLEIVDAWGDPLRFEFQQRIIVPAEHNVGPVPGLNRSGVWEVPDPSIGAVFTDFGAVIPNLPSEIRFYVTSDNLLELDGDLVDFLSSDSIPQLDYQ